MHHGNTKLHLASDKVDTARKATRFGSPSACCIEEAATLLTGTRPCSPCVIDFFEAHAGSAAAFEESCEICTINRKAREGNAGRLYSIEPVDRLEESLHWLLLAITLIYLIVAIIGL
jgi:hypothetical protein